MKAQPSFSTASSSRGDSKQRRLRVVVIDDEPDTVMTLLALLREQGFQADGFASGRRGLEGIEELAPDVIISDIVMPPPNGWDIARQVRMQRPAAPPLMIAISGQYTKAADRLLAQAAGFDYFLTKPCDPQVLMALIRGQGNN